MNEDESNFVSPDGISVELEKAVAESAKLAAERDKLEAEAADIRKQGVERDQLRTAEIAKLRAEQLKAEAEADKFRAEAADLRKNVFLRPVTWLTLGAAFIALAAGLGTYLAKKSERVKDAENQAKIAEQRLEEVNGKYAERARQLADVYEKQVAVLSSRLPALDSQKQDAERKLQQAKEKLADLNDRSRTASIQAKVAKAELCVQRITSNTYEKIGLNDENISCLVSALKDTSVRSDVESMLNREFSRDEADANYDVDQYDSYVMLVFIRYSALKRPEDKATLERTIEVKGEGGPPYEINRSFRGKIIRDSGLFSDNQIGYFAAQSMQSVPEEYHGRIILMAQVLRWLNDGNKLSLYPEALAIGYEGLLKDLYLDREIHQNKLIQDSDEHGRKQYDCPFPTRLCLMAAAWSNWPDSGGEMIFGDSRDGYRTIHFPVPLECSLRMEYRSTLSSPSFSCWGKLRETFRHDYEIIKNREMLVNLSPAELKELASYE